MKKKNPSQIVSPAVSYSELYSRLSRANKAVEISNTEIERLKQVARHLESERAAKSLELSQTKFKLTNSNYICGILAALLLCSLLFTLFN